MLLAFERCDFMIKNTSKAITSSEMNALELNAEYLGVSALQLMENAGHAVSLEVAARFKSSDSVIVVAGVGRKGGDGFVAARHLASRGFKVTVILMSKPEDIVSENAKKNWESIVRMRDTVKTIIVYGSSLISKLDAKVIIDALLGFGVSGPLRSPLLQAVKAINKSKAFKVAIDLPTGVNPDNGQILGDAVVADLTVTFHRPKVGLLKASKYVGELSVAGIGIPREAETYVGPGDVLIVRKPRPTESHKGDFGRLLIIGGNETFAGAPTLVALAALRVGVDLAYVAAPNKTAHDIASMAPDLITVKLEGEHLNPRNVEVIEEWLKRSDAVVFGPGIGLHEDTVKAVGEVISVIGKAKKPLLLDADALKAFPRSKRKIDFPVVFTPHSGEFEILTGKTPPKELQKRVECVQEAAKTLKAVILLKGPVDIISNGEAVKLNFAHNPGMTVGGTGDVLSGIVGAFLAQGFDPFRSAVAGAFVNGAAGDFVARETGYHMMPTDLIKWIPTVIDDPMSHLKVRQKT